MARFDEQSPSLAVSHGFRPCSTANGLDILVDSVGLGDMEGDRKGTWNGKSWVRPGILIWAKLSAAANSGSGAWALINGDAHSLLSHRSVLCR